MCILNDRRQKVGIGKGVFFVQNSEKVILKIAFRIQFYSDVIFFVIRQSDRFRVCRNTDRQQPFVQSIDANRQLCDKRVSFAFNNCVDHVSRPPLLILLN